MVLFYLFSCARAAPSSRECCGKARQAVPDKEVVKGLDFLDDFDNTAPLERLLSWTGSIGRDRMAGLTLRSLPSLLIIITLQ